MHRDIKPSNILLDWRGTVKLCDFGISRRLVESRAYTRQAGCYYYMAPERFNVDASSYDVRSDVWSLGITLVELATGKYPYSGNDCAIASEIVNGALPRLPSMEDNDGEVNIYVFLTDEITSFSGSPILTNVSWFRREMPSARPQRPTKLWRTSGIDFISSSLLSLLF